MSSKLLNLDDELHIPLELVACVVAFSIDRSNSLLIPKCLSNDKDI